MRINYVQIIKRLVVAIVVTLILCELLLRILFDFPLYDFDREVGYWPKANQRGSFLLTHDWAFDANSLGGAPTDGRPAGFRLLVVGDSVVYGGNPFKQSDKVTSIVARQTGWQVRSAAAGGWALQNELTFINRRPNVLADADAIVFVVNSGDFAEPASWYSEITHPRTRPPIYLWYAFDKCCRAPNSTPTSALKVPQANVADMWERFVNDRHVPIIVVAYSSFAEEGANCSWVPKEFKAKGKWFCYQDFGPETQDDFRDPIHPSVRGNRKLARAIDTITRSVMSDRAVNASLPQKPH